MHLTIQQQPLPGLSGRPVSGHRGPLRLVAVHVPPDLPGHHHRGQPFMYFGALLQGQGFLQNILQSLAGLYEDI